MMKLHQGNLVLNDSKFSSLVAAAWQCDLVSVLL